MTQQVKKHGANSSAVQPNNWQAALPRPAYEGYARIDVSAVTSWYAVYRLFPDVFCLYEPGHFQEVISFLIVGQTYALLWDTGMGLAPIRPVVEALTDLPVVVINSHSHFDHVGGNWAFPFVLSWPGLGAAARAAQGYSHAFLQPMLGPESFALPLPAGANLDSFTIAPWQALPLHKDLPDALPQPGGAALSSPPYLVRVSPFANPPGEQQFPPGLAALHTGLAFSLGGRRLDILLTPGHTDDSIMLLDWGRRLLFTGDTVYPAALYAHFDSREYGRSSLDIYANTMDILQCLVPHLDALCCSHNIPVCPPALLSRVAAGFAAIRQGGCGSKTDEDGLQRYDFDGFAIITK